MGLQTVVKVDSSDPLRWQKNNNILFLCRIETVVKAGVVAHACNTSTWEVETGKSGVQELQLCSNFKTSLLYMRPCLLFSPTSTKTDIMGNQEGPLVSIDM